MASRIVKALEVWGRLTTPELAIRLGAGRDRVFSCCKRLEKDGRVTSELVAAGPENLFFFPMTKEVVARENYERITNLNDSFLETIRMFSLPQEQAGLVAALELLLEANAVDHEFGEELLAAAATAHKQKDVASILGIRPMYPRVRLWSVGPQLVLALPAALGK